MSIHHELPQEQAHPEITVRRADLTVRVVLWVVMGLVALALMSWFFLT